MSHLIYLDAGMAAQEEIKFCRVADLGVNDSACKQMKQGRSIMETRSDYQRTQVKESLA